MVFTKEELGESGGMGKRKKKKTSQTCTLYKLKQYKECKHVSLGLLIGALLPWFVEHSGVYKIFWTPIFK